MSGISKGWRVLDVACGTGAVAQQLLQRTGNGGLVVGVDASHTALLLAKKYVRVANFHPVICDAENMRFSGKPFDAATCQFGLFFFADAQKALKNIRRSLKSRGVLAMAVHGRDTPFYSSILKAVEKYIPEYKEPGTPDMTRGTGSICKLWHKTWKKYGNYGGTRDIRAWKIWNTHRRFTHSGSNISSNAQIYKKTSYSLGIFCRYNNNLPGKFYHTLVCIWKNVFSDLLS